MSMAFTRHSPSESSSMKLAGLASAYTSPRLWQPAMKSSTSASTHRASSSPSLPPASAIHCSSVPPDSTSVTRYTYDSSSKRPTLRTTFSVAPCIICRRSASRCSLDDVLLGFWFFRSLDSFFTATCSPVVESSALYTVPKLPDPSLLSSSKRLVSKSGQPRLTGAAGSASVRASVVLRLGGAAWRPPKNATTGTLFLSSDRRR
mmetsp:Transcript_41340/g.104776  ORF Transcript_41340/g.104776 Transcript_41340/m.104776 type:complete len:204 (+) Transcript_41340:777-1388(+)